MSLALHRHVANFGGFGYAPDQALLKYKIRHAARRPRVAVLAITPDELARILNRYKQFFDRGLVTIGLKPRVILDGGELKLIRQPADGTTVSRDNLLSSPGGSRRRDNSAAGAGCRVWKAWAVRISSIPRRAR